MFHSADLPNYSIDYNAKCLFLKGKAYREQATLFYPSEGVVDFIKKLENATNAAFVQVIYIFMVYDSLCVKSKHLCNVPVEL